MCSLAAVLAPLSFSTHSMAGRLSNRLVDEYDDVEEEKKEDDDYEDDNENDEKKVKRRIVLAAPSTASK